MSCAVEHIRVLIADDHSLFAEALQAILGTDERFEVVALARNGREAIDRALEHALRAAAALPRPNDAARAAAAEHDLSRQARRIEEILERAATGRRA